MSAAKYSFVIEQGATFNLNLQYLDGNDDYVDLSQYSGKMQLRPTVESTTAYITLSSSLQPDNTGINFPQPTSGSINIYISAVSSSLLDFDTAVYDLELYSGSFVARLLEGNVKLSKNVTR